MANSLWNSRINPDQAIESFTAALDKDNATKGNVVDDYMAIADSYHLTTCPHVTCFPGKIENTETVRLANVDLDLSNWRSLLLACCVINSKVTEIYLHNCNLSSQHIVDLAAALSKIGTIKTLRLQYIDFGITEANEAKLGEAMKSLLADSTGLSYVSITHCALPDAIGQTIASTLSRNFVLVGLNLSFNGFTDATLAQVVGSLRLTTNVKYLCLRGNGVDGSSLSGLLSQCLGSETNAADDATIKANAKALGDKNKAIKDNNKKRKKAGHVELPELPALPEVVSKVGGKTVVVNQSLNMLDLGENPVALQHLEAAVQVLTGGDQELLASCPLQIRVSSSVVGEAGRALLSAHEKLFSFV
ncbi:hypothetical protein EON65_23010 [archaeon]|nr:MAG: hypothetical protein EON65_23010 [archaeon]